jgi:hypothetical protein
LRLQFDGDGGTPKTLQSATVAAGTATSTGTSLLPESATAGEVALAYAHAFGTGDFALACEYQPSHMEGEGAASCGEKLRKGNEKQEDGEEPTAFPWRRPEFADATLESETATQAGETVTLKPPRSSNVPPLKVLLERTDRAAGSGAWRLAFEAFKFE